MSTDLIRFLRARLDEEEQAATLMAQHYPAPWEIYDRGWMAHVVADGPRHWDVVRLEQWSDQPTGADAPGLGEIIAHIARHDPARVLADIEAKREVVRLTERAYDYAQTFTSGFAAAMEQALRMFAVPYAGHPDYPEE